MTAPRLSACIEGIGLLGPGLADWSQGRAILAGEAAYAPAPSQLPAVAALPPAERRRVGRAVKLALAVGQQAVTMAGLDAAALATVFSSSGADGDNCHEICAQLASDDKLISPTRFHNSVHNAPAGYWSIATGAMAPSSVLCAYDASFGAGLIEAMAYAMTAAPRCLLIAYDSSYPEPLRSARPVPDAFGIALALTAAPSPGCLARIELTPAQGRATAMADAGLEALRRDYPAGRGLPLLAALARGGSAELLLDYLDDCRLAVTVSPCR